MSHLVIGLMSGTSVDGIDAALVNINKRSIKLVDFDTYSYPSQLREQILKTSSPGGGSTQKVCRLNVLLGEIFADAAFKIITKARIKPNDVSLIGSHGQTIQHLPNPVEQYGYNIRATLQLGEASIIAQRTGITTVADFRPADIAVGGQGAPLLPLLHYHLFRGNEDVIVQNIGGISNLTYIPTNGEIDDIIAFDTGPGNMLLDGLVEHYSKGEENYDHAGAKASRGDTCQPLLDELLKHPFLSKIPPKTCGREEFGKKFINKILKGAKKYQLSVEDTLHTVTDFTAQCIIRSYKDFIPPKAQIKNVLVAGGGQYNLTLMFLLQRGLEIPLSPVDDHGVCGDALEAMGFALLAHETMCGRPGNVPSATGARRPAILGKVVWGRNYSYWQKFC